MRTRVLTASIAALLLAGAAAGCSSESSTAEAEPLAAGAAAEAAPGVEAAGVALAEQRTVIDVRTPEEYAEGHVLDAVNLNVQDPSFDSEIAALDADGTYVVYCRSGNRSATAAERMRAAGLDVLDGGALGDMADAGWPTS